MPQSRRRQNLRRPRAVALLVLALLPQLVLPAGSILHLHASGTWSWTSSSLAHHGGQDSSGLSQDRAVASSCCGSRSHASGHTHSHDAHSYDTHGSTPHHHSHSHSHHSGSPPAESSGSESSGSGECPESSCQNVHSVSPMLRAERLESELEGRLVATGELATIAPSLTAQERSAPPLGIPRSPRNGDASLIPIRV